MTGHGYSGPMDHPADPPHVLGSDHRVTALEDQVRELRRDLDRVTSTLEATQTALRELVKRASGGRCRACDVVGKCPCVREKGHDGEHRCTHGLEIDWVVTP